MTSELKPNKIISEVVCAGPKNYAYRTVNLMKDASKTVCKVRGITLNYLASAGKFCKNKKHNSVYGYE
jgi:hypothetical protein